MANVLLGRGWIVRHVMISAAVAACLVAGFWQLDRAGERRARNARLAAAASGEPLELTTAPASSEAPRRARAAGRYDTKREIVLRDRAFAGRPGEHRLTPLRFADGSAVLVDRGWVPSSIPSQDARNADPPAGDVLVDGLLLPRERPLPLTPETAPTGSTTARIDTLGLAPRFPYRLAPVYLLLASQTPAQRGGLPAIIPAPRPAGGPPHLAYAVQWFTFAAIALGGHALLARRAIRPPEKQRGRPAGGPSVHENERQGSR